VFSLTTLRAKCPSGEKTSALHKACEFASVDLVKLILEKGGRVLLDKQDIKGSTPLIIAAGEVVRACVVGV
jgi:ankyrin repeat protein